ncbi:MAG: Holliday junction resolvase RuvX [SAR202 cluster bacterium]|nr:Holliday junction resolvase RuvX [SAR202 cluster bacterium]
MPGEPGGSPKRRALALDVGERRIGLAVGDTETMLAVPAGHIQRARTGADFIAVLKTARDREADVIVVGMPLTVRGEMGPQALAVGTFVNGLRAHTDMPVVEWDERYTTVEAEHRMRVTRPEGSRGRGLSWRPAKGDVDAAAAAVLLQSWLDAQQEVA